MQLARNFAVLQAEHHLRETRHARSVLQVTDIRLHRADQAWHIARIGFAEDVLNRFHLDGITDRSSRAMNLDVAKLPRRYAGLIEGFTDHRLLRERR